MKVSPETGLVEGEDDDLKIAIKKIDFAISCKLIIVRKEQKKGQAILMHLQRNSLLQLKKIKVLNIGQNAVFVIET